MHKNKNESQPQVETESKFIGVAVPKSFHQQLREIAASEGLNLSGLLRQALIERVARPVRRVKQAVK